MTTREVSVLRLGSRGDGVAETESGRLHIPFTAPGDLARVAPRGKGAAELVTLLAPGPARVAAPCRHFGRCGGCALQHLDPQFTAAWKRERVVEALAAAGIAGATVVDTVAIPPGARRRATLAAKRSRSRVLLGFAERASHRLVDLVECKVLRPELVGLLPRIRDLLAQILTEGEGADLSLTAAENGIELVLIRRRPLGLDEREMLAAFAESHDLARVAWRAAPNRPAEPVAERRAPLVRFGGFPVLLPPGAFLQPSAEGEASLMRLVLGALRSDNAPIVDLFCGLGTFTLPASAIGPVAAFDGDGEAIAALQSTIRANGLAPRLSAARRDLFRDPLTAEELGTFGAAILDPPRAGAEAQSRALAMSRVRKIAAVSCNPASFARDAAILAAGGYRLRHVTPVDQFLWSPHVELAALFERI